jgi:hypothetical protein
MYFSLVILTVTSVEAIPNRPTFPRAWLNEDEMQGGIFY